MSIWFYTAIHSFYDGRNNFEYISCHQTVSATKLIENRFKKEKVVFNINSEMGRGKY